MELEKYYSLEGQTVSFSRDQASLFAKTVAGDYNPIHNVDSRLFCVPGDLLFSLVVSRYGLAANTSVSFDGIVNDKSRIHLPDSVDRTLALIDQADKQCLNVTYSERPVVREPFVSSLIAQYVTFSGKTFPDILVELMKQHQVMINPARPLVMYRSMSVELQPNEATAPQLRPLDSTMQIQGKKGEAVLRFEIYDGDTKIGTGRKTMLLGGLRAYEEEVVAAIVANYITARDAGQAITL